MPGRFHRLKCCCFKEFLQRGLNWTRAACPTRRRKGHRHSVFARPLNGTGSLLADVHPPSNHGLPVCLEGDAVPLALVVLRPVVAYDLGSAKLIEPSRLGAVAARLCLQTRALLLLDHHDGNRSARKAGTSRESDE